MLSPLALRVIAEPGRLTPTELRLFLRLLADYDLTRYRALHMQRLVGNYSMAADTISDVIAKLVSLGILEEGPQGKIRGKHQRLNTYRVRPAYLLNPQAMLDWFRECSEREERESLLRTELKGPVPQVV